jgi:hypothetical protein
MSIAIQWAVFPALSSDAMIATGVTDKPGMAQSVVEAIMAISPNAGWGEVVRIAVPGERPSDAELREWPPPGEVWVCRRAADDGEHKWMPLFPDNWPSPVREEASI